MNIIQRPLNSLWYLRSIKGHGQILMLICSGPWVFWLLWSIPFMQFLTKQIFPLLLSPPVQLAWWAFMQHFPSVCLSVQVGFSL